MNRFRNTIKVLSKYLPWSLQDRFIFFIKFGRFPKVKHPETFNEKILYRKQHAIQDERFGHLSDKYRVREYVEKIIGDHYFVPLFFYTHEPDSLANYNPSCDIIIKPNHGAGMYKIVRKSHYAEEVKNLIPLCKAWLDLDFSHVQREIHYRNIPRMILVERLIGDGLTAPSDYKFHMFRKTEGGFNYVLQIINERFSGSISRTFYLNNCHTPFDTGLSRAASGALDDSYAINTSLALEALVLSEALAAGFDYIRVDWYVHEDQLYFSELTFTPAAGFGIGYGERLDRLMGTLWI